MNWRQYFRGIVHQIKLKSKDRYTQIGAVIVGNNNQIVSTGYNSFPRGIDDSLDIRQERPEKYYWFSHAETNAIVNSALNGISTNGTTMYMSCGIPCADCARNIINAGIVKIICETANESTFSEKWDEHAKRSIEMFNEAGIVIEYY